jgi:hypothetical protein
VTESAIAPNASETQVRSVVVLGQLAVAYLDRMAVSDWARAGVVLSVFSQTYNAELSAVRAWVQGHSPNPSAALNRLPAAVRPFYDTAARQAIQAMLAITVSYSTSSSSTTLQQWLAALDAMPQAAIAVGPWWMGTAGTLAQQLLTTPTWSLSRNVAATDMGSLGSTLQQNIQGYLTTGHGAWNDPGAGVAPFDRPTPAPTPAPSPPVNQITTLLTETITAPVPRFQMPVWGWWAIGLGGVAAAGVFTWGVLEQGWFGLKKPARGGRSGATSAEALGSRHPRWRLSRSWLDRDVRAEPTARMVPKRAP